MLNLIKLEDLNLKPELEERLNLISDFRFQNERELWRPVKRKRKLFLTLHQRHCEAIIALKQQMREEFSPRLPEGRMSLFTQMIEELKRKYGQSAERKAMYEKTLLFYLDNEEAFRRQFPKGEMTEEEFQSVPVVIAGFPFPLLDEQEEWIQKRIERWNKRHDKPFPRKYQTYKK